MADEIIVEYKARLDKLTKDLDGLEKEMLGVDKAAKKSMDTLEKESKQAGTAVQKVDKNVSGLNDKLQNLANNIPGAFAVQEVLQFGQAVIGSTKSVAGMSNGMKILKFAIASTGIGLLVTAVASLIAYFKSTEEGGDKLAKVMRVLGAIFSEVTKELAKIGEVLFSAGEAFVSFVGGSEKAKVSTDDYKKSVIELAAEIADLEDRISALTFSVALQNEKLQTGIEQNLKALRNRNLSYGESKKIIEQIGTLEEEKLKNTNNLLDQKVEKERKEFLLKTKAFEEEQKTTVVTMRQARRQEGESDEQWRARLNRLKSERDEARKMFSEKQLLFDKFTKGELTALEFTDKARGLYTEEDAKRITDILIQKEQATRESLVLGERLKNFDDAAFEKSKAQAEQRKANEDKAFQDKIAHLTKVEQLEIRTAKIAEANQIELITIERKYNQEKIRLFQQYGKDKGIEYDNLLLNEKEFDAQITKIVKDGLEKRKTEDEKAAKDLKASRVKAIQDTVKANKEKNDILIKQDQEADAKKIKDAEEREKKIRAILAESIEIAGNLINTIVQVRLDKDLAEIQSEQNKNDKETEIQLAALEKRRQNGEISEKTAAAQKEAILAKSAKREADLKRKAFEAQKKADLTAILINTAVAVTKTLATLGVPAGLVAAAIVAAQGALQYAAVKSKKAPQFGEGGEVIGKSHKQGGELIEAEHGEFVVRKKAYQTNKDLIKHINDGKPAEDYFMKDIAGVMIAKQKKAQAKEKQMSEAALKAMISKSDINLEEVERRLKSNKTVNIGNADQIASLIAKKMNSNHNPEMK